jgi:hypothetical protein
MKTARLGLAVACFLSMAAPVALPADLARTYERNFTPREGAGCSCDAPGVIGLICATPYRCQEMDGLCVGRCTNSVKEGAGCSCDAPGVIGLVCATPERCMEMTGLCAGGC